MKPRGREPRGRARRLLDLEELAKAIPGGAGPQHDVKSLILQVLSYIEFLQSRIQDVQKSLVSTEAPRELLYRTSITPKQNKVYGPLRRPRKSRPKESCGSALQSRKRLLMSECRETKQANPQENTELGIQRADGSKEHSDLEFEETLRQTLVPYLSPSSSDNGDAGPWLRSISISPGMPHSGNLLGTPQMFSTPSPYLGLSPSLFSSPGDDLHHEESSEVLFEEVQLSSRSSPDLQSSPTLAFTLDHSYQSSSENNSIIAAFRHSHQPHLEIKTEDEVGNYNFQPQIKRTEKKRSRKAMLKKECSPGFGDGGSPTFSLKAQTGGKGHKRRSKGFTSRLQCLRKKCVNGFIMYCRLNRRLYLSAHPGTASTAATKELAEVWRKMSAQERRPYCIKAYHFSVLHDRLVKQGSSGLLRENLSPPKPISVLLAEKICIQGSLDQYASAGQKVEPQPL